MSLGDRLFTLGIGIYELQYDRNYGIRKRHGWSVIIDGSVYAELQPWLVMAIWKAVRFRWAVLRDPSRPKR